MNRATRPSGEGGGEPFQPEWPLLRDLHAAFGPGFYVADIVRFRRNYRDFLGAFRNRYARTTIGYSYKTNYLPSICRAVDALNGYAEVVSGMEYELAVRLGVPARRIIYNGPWKPAHHFRTALLAGATVNLDGPAEIEEVERLSGEFPGDSLRVGLRCNLESPGAARSRFGFDVQGGQLGEAIGRLRARSNVRIAGLHSHVSSGERQPTSFRWRAERLIELAREYFPQTGPEFLNLGGGYFGRMPDELRRQFPGHVAEYDEYAEEITAPFVAAWGRVEGPELILEPGTALVSDCVLFVAAVIDVKQLRGRRVAVCAGSVHNIKPTLHGKQLPCDIVKPSQGGSDGRTGIDPGTDIVGYTCMEHDVLREAAPGPIEVGDYAVFRNVGAYTIVMQPPFIMPAPPIVSWDPSGGGVVLARRAQDMEDVFAAYDLEPVVAHQERTP